jgi:flagella basal body P-ring formation protein FlgA
MLWQLRAASIYMYVALSFGMHAHATAGPAPTQSLADIRSIAESTVRELLPASTGKWILTAAPLDARLSLPTCAAPRAAATSAPRAGQSRVIVAVRCDSPSVWAINVPVDIEIEATVLIANAPIARGAVLLVGDFTTESRRTRGLTTRFLSDPSDLQLRTARRPIAPGEVLTVDAVKDAKLIERGQLVTLVAADASVTIRAPARALADAGMRERVRAQNLQSLRVVEGIAIAADTIQVGGIP